MKCTIENVKEEKRHWRKSWCSLNINLGNISPIWQPPGSFSCVDNDCSIYRMARRRKLGQLNEPRIIFLISVCIRAKSHKRAIYTGENQFEKPAFWGFGGNFHLLILEYPFVKTLLFNSSGFWWVVRMCHLLVLCMSEHGSEKNMNNLPVLWEWVFTLRKLFNFQPASKQTHSPEVGLLFGFFVILSVVA